MLQSRFGAVAIDNSFHRKTIDVDHGPMPGDRRAVIVRRVMFEAACSLGL